MIEVIELLEAIQGKKIPRSHTKDMTRAHRRRALRARREGLVVDVDERPKGAMAFREVPRSVIKELPRHVYIEVFNKFKLTRPFGIRGSLKKVVGTDATIRRHAHHADRTAFRSCHLPDIFREIHHKEELPS